MIVNVKMVGSKEAIQKIVEKLNQKFEVSQVHDFRVDDKNRGFYCLYIIEVKENE